MRVITGKYKGRRFEVPRTFRGHPTTDFAKENLFNILRGYVDLEGATCLDLFAGTGSITLEMLSRGASHVVAVEMDHTHATFIRQCLDHIGEENCSLICADAFRYLKKCQQSFNLIFADPPYDHVRLASLPDIIFSSQLLAPEGIFVLEHGKNHLFATHPHFLEQRTYGKVNFSLFSAH